MESTGDKAINLHDSVPLAQSCVLMPKAHSLTGMGK